MRELVLACALGAIGCEAPPRGQAVLFVDTDLPVPRFADTLRVERLDGTRVVERRDQAAPDPSDWPLSFGVAPQGAPVRLRLRLFSSSRVAVAGGDGGAEGDPLTAFTIDRIVELAPRADRVERWVVTLAGRCVGLAADPSSGASCTADSDAAPPGAGLTPLARPLASADSAVGTWSEATATPCAGAPRPDSPLADGEVCVPGGVFFLGDQRLASSKCSPGCNTAPEKLVRMSPFWLDRYEVTVGRWKDAVRRGFQPPPASWLSNNTVCSYRVNSVNDRRPLSCVTWAAARAFCRFDGRDLVSEAQWEYAASGRGEERMYVWGDLPLPHCEAATYARADPAANGGGLPGSSSECWTLGLGAEDVGTRAPDTTVDGARDLEGNLKEWARDEAQDYGAGCWTAEVRPRDPVCEHGVQAGIHTQRGGTWGGGSGLLAAAWRDGRDDTWTFPSSPHWMGPVVGFRCSRRGTP